MTNLERVIERVERARLAYDSKAVIKLVAVSKYTDSKAIEGLYKEGQRAFGENRVQDLKTKTSSLSSLPLEWHFLGRIQTNKINALLEQTPFLIQSIDSYESAAEIDKRAKVKNMKIRALMQINSANEETKAGVEPKKAFDEYLKISEDFDNIDLRGVMTIGAHTEDRQEIQKSFEVCRALYEQLTPSGAKICSMGMSSDFELAIACGSNMLRLGSILFENK